MEPFLTKNTKNRTKQNVYGTIGKITNEDGTIKFRAIVLERNGTFSKKSERAPALMETFVVSKFDS